MRTIVEMRFGSHLYGTSTPASDQDFKAVHIPDARGILLGDHKKVISTMTKLDRTERNTADDTDTESFTLQHYLKLLMEGQTVCLDMLFAPSEMLLTTSGLWEDIRENKKRFISKKCDSYIGYCRQQANKYGIKGSRVAAVRLVVDTLTKILDSGMLHSLAKLSQCEEPLKFLAEQNEFIKIIDIPTPSGGVVRHLECCNRKTPLTNPIKTALDLYTKLLNDYGKRSLAAESNEGVDWKALSHAVRVGHQAVSLLQTGEIEFPLYYAGHLLEIKTGQLPYQEVAEEIEELLDYIEAAASVSKLPDEPDYQFAEQIVLHYYAEEVMRARDQVS